MGVGFRRIRQNRQFVAAGRTPVRERIPIWVAALRIKLVELAAECADGLIGRPMWSRHWALEEMKPAVEAKLATAGRRREDIEVNLWAWAAPNPDEA